MDKLLRERIAQGESQTVAEAFYLTNDIEKYGSGYIRVREAIADYPTMEFEYEEMGNGYLVTIGYKEQKTTQETKRISTRERVVLALAKDPSLTRNDLSTILSVSANAIKQHLSKLKNEGRIKRVGSTKAGYWEVLDEK